MICVGWLGGSPKEELEELAEEKKVWATLLSNCRLAPMCLGGGGHYLKTETNVKKHKRKTKLWKIKTEMGQTGRWDADMHRCTHSQGTLPTFPHTSAMIIKALVMMWWSAGTPATLDGKYEEILLKGPAWSNTHTQTLPPTLPLAWKVATSGGIFSLY